jgi:preprotein translocase subunit SecA
MLSFIKKILGTAQDRKLKKYKKTLALVNQWEQQLIPLSNEELRAKTSELRHRYQRGTSLDQLLPEAYGLVKAACRHICGTVVEISGYEQSWDMVPFDVQIVGAIAMHEGNIAEMQTGEGKTLTASMPLFLHAITGRGVHLVTVNDYLAHRDCLWIGTLFRFLGLTTGVISQDLPPHLRRQIYQCDIVYGTASEFGFDYLRDHSSASTTEEQVQRPFYFAIIDEIDSILIDEARTPLIISGPVASSNQMYDQLSTPVATLVTEQRNLCNEIAFNAKKAYDQLIKNRRNPESWTKEEESTLQKITHDLWIVSKGVPRHRILRKLQEETSLRELIDKWDIHYYSEQFRAEKNKKLANLFFTIDEKADEFELTDKGISAWVSFSNDPDSVNDFVMLDISTLYMKIESDPELSSEAKRNQLLKMQEEDRIRKERAHNLRQLLRAHLLMEKDVDYILAEGQIVIVDENTGRPQPGRRFSDGLHQAIEAKEGVSIQGETQTYATITLQNYFKLYPKLAGMSGTAITEAREFHEIYKLDVLQIPTHRTSKRKLLNDKIFMTQREKYGAIINEIVELHHEQRPILVGTDSVEVSEKISMILRQRNIPHHVLNAKQHDQEAKVIALAGHKGAITIATNMAGRGTDIKLAPGVADLGGLHVIGTTRNLHRIDNQLSGRCARQGDPGSVQFYLSFEDPLLRMFSSPTMTQLLKKYRPPEGQSFSAKILDHSISTAKKRIEQRNYTMRKYTLEYDNVMNKQRQEVYQFRDEILKSHDIKLLAEDLLESTADAIVLHFYQRDSYETPYTQSLYQWFIEQYPAILDPQLFQQELFPVEEYQRLIRQTLINLFIDKYSSEIQIAQEHYDETLDMIELHCSSVIRQLLLNQLDTLWQDHLLQMDHLRTEIQVRSIGQKDPLMEFKQEAFKLFSEFTHQLKTHITQQLFQREWISPPKPRYTSNLFSFIHNPFASYAIEDEEEEDE